MQCNICGSMISQRMDLCETCRNTGVWIFVGGHLDHNPLVMNGIGRLTTLKKVHEWLVKHGHAKPSDRWTDWQVDVEQYWNGGENGSFLLKRLTPMKLG